MQVPKDFVPYTVLHHTIIKQEPMECAEEESTNLNENTFQDCVDIVKLLQSAKPQQIPVIKKEHFEVEPTAPRTHFLQTMFDKVAPDQTLSNEVLTQLYNFFKEIINSEATSSDLSLILKILWKTCLTVD